MKVAMVFDGIGFGGIERVGINYVRLFKDLGHEVDIYNLKPEKNEMEKELDGEYKIFHYKYSNLFMPDYYMLIVKRWRWGKYVYPFIYIISSILMYGYRLLLGKRKKYDITIAFSGHFRDLSFVAYNFVRGSKKICWLHGALMEYLVLSCTFGNLYEKIKNLCVLSEDRQEAALDANKYLIDKLNIHKIYNPINTNKREIDKEKCKNIKKTFGNYILMIGRFEMDKDQKTVIRAYKILKEKYRCMENLVFVGDGSTLQECKELTIELGLQENIFFVGAQYDVENYYSTAQVFIHSSKAEGLPTVLLEAMVYEIPIVATDSPPGVSEILGNNQYGLKCAIANPEDMADKIHMILIDQMLSKSYVELGKEKVKEFGYDHIEKQLNNILDCLI